MKNNSKKLKISLSVIFSLILVVAIVLGCVFGIKNGDQSITENYNSSAQSNLTAVQQRFFSDLEQSYSLTATNYSSQFDFSQIDDLSSVVVYDNWYYVTNKDSDYVEVYYFSKNSSGEVISNLYFDESKQAVISVASDDSLCYIYQNGNYSYIEVAKYVKDQGFEITYRFSISSANTLIIDSHIYTCTNFYLYGDIFALELYDTENNLPTIIVFDPNETYLTDSEYENYQVISASNISINEELSEDNVLFVEYDNSLAVFSYIEEFEYLIFEDFENLSVVSKFLSGVVIEDNQNYLIYNYSTGQSVSLSLDAGYEYTFSNNSKLDYFYVFESPLSESDKSVGLIVYFDANGSVVARYEANSFDEAIYFIAGENVYTSVGILQTNSNETISYSQKFADGGYELVYVDSYSKSYVLESLQGDYVIYDALNGKTYEGYQTIYCVGDGLYFAKNSSQVVLIDCVNNSVLEQISDEDDNLNLIQKTSFYFVCNSDGTFSLFNLYSGEIESNITEFSVSIMLSDFDGVSVSIENANGSENYIFSIHDELDVFYVIESATGSGEDENLQSVSNIATLSAQTYADATNYSINISENTNANYSDYAYVLEITNPLNKFLSSFVVTISDVGKYEFSAETYGDNILLEQVINSIDTSTTTTGSKNISYVSLYSISYTSSGELEDVYVVYTIYIQGKGDDSTGEVSVSDVTISNPDNSSEDVVIKDIKAYKSTVYVSNAIGTYLSSFTLVFSDGNDVIGEYIFEASETGMSVLLQSSNRDGYISYEENYNIYNSSGADKQTEAFDYVFYIYYSSTVSEANISIEDSKTSYIYYSLILIYGIDYGYGVASVLINGEAEDSYACQYNSVVGATIEVVLRAGYEFVGWYDSNSTDGKLISAEANFIYNETMGYNDVYIYAITKPIEYFIVYDLNDGEKGDGNSYPTSAIFDEFFNVTTPVKTGYVFAGWYITGMDEGVEGEYEHVYGEYSTTATFIELTDATVFGNLRSSSGVVTFKAIWNEISYTVNITLYDGETDIEYGSFDDILTIENPTRDGYSFVGWTITGMDTNTVHYFGYNETEGTWRYTTQSTSVSNITDTTFMNLRSDGGVVSFVANWQKIDYLIEFDYDGGEGNNVTSASFDEPFSVSTPTKTGYVFAGWIITGLDDCEHYLSFDESSDEWTTTNETTLTTDAIKFMNLRSSSGTVYFKAVWTAIKYDVKFSYDNGDSSQTITVSYDEKFEVEIPEKTGYTFAGWTISNMDSSVHQIGDSQYSDAELSGVTAVKFMNLRTSSGTVSFVATWTPIVYNVEIDLNGGVVDKISSSQDYDLETQTLDNVQIKIYEYIAEQTSYLSEFYEFKKGNSNTAYIAYVYIESLDQSGILLVSKASANVLYTMTLTTYNSSGSTLSTQTLSSSAVSIKFNSETYYYSIILIDGDLTEYMGNYMGNYNDANNPEMMSVLNIYETTTDSVINAVNEVLNYSIRGYYSASSSAVGELATFVDFVDNDKKTYVFTKTNNLTSYVAVVYLSSIDKTGVLLVSTEPSAVFYSLLIDDAISYTSSEYGSFVYNNITYYYSNYEGFIDGNMLEYLAIDSNRYSFSTSGSLEDASKQLLDYYKTSQTLYDIEYDEYFTVYAPVRAGYVFAGFNIYIDNVLTYALVNEIQYLNLATINGATVRFVANWSAISYNIEIDLAGGSLSGVSGTIDIDVDSAGEEIAILSVNKYFKLNSGDAYVAVVYLSSVDKTGIVLIGKDANSVAYYCYGGTLYSKFIGNNTSFKTITYGGETYYYSAYSEEFFIDGRVTSIGNTARFFYEAETLETAVASILESCVSGLLLYTAKYDSKFSIENPTREGYTFDGWEIVGYDGCWHYYGDLQTTGNPYDTDTETYRSFATWFMNLLSSSSTITLIAHWKANEYTITYHYLPVTSGGSEIDYIQDYTNDELNNTSLMTQTQTITVTYDEYMFMLKGSYSGSSGSITIPSGMKLLGWAFFTDVQSGLCLIDTTTNQPNVTYYYEEGEYVAFNFIARNVHAYAIYLRNDVDQLFDESDITIVVMGINESNASVQDSDYNDISEYTVLARIENAVKLGETITLSSSVLGVSLNNSIGFMISSTLYGEGVLTRGSVSSYTYSGTTYYAELDAQIVWGYSSTNTTDTESPVYYLYVVYNYLEYVIEFNNNLPDGAKINFSTSSSDGSTSIVYRIYVSASLGDQIEFEMPELEYTASGYLLLGYATDKDANTSTYAGSDTKYISKSTYADRQNVITLYAIWQQGTYYISYDYDGGTGSNSSSSAYNSIVTLNVPTKTGYTFIGWQFSELSNDIHYYGSSESSLNRIAGESFTVLTSDVLYVKNLSSKVYYTDSGGVYYAKVTALWTANSYNLTYDYDGGTDQGPNPSTATYDNEITLTTPYRYGYTFIGWKVEVLNSSGSVIQTLYESTTNMTFINLTTDEGATVRFTALWQTAPSYSIEFSLDGGTITGATTTIENGLTIFYVPDPVKVGYVFAGWYITGMTDDYHGYGTSSSEIYKFTGTSRTFDGGISYFQSLSSNGGTVTFTALWQKATYNISYNLNGGEHSADADVPINISFDEEFTVAVPQRVGYTFVGWMIDGMDEACTHYIGSVTTTSTTYKYETTSATTFKNLRSTSATVTLTALWQAIEYNVSYEYGGGTVDVDSENPTSVSFDDWFTVVTPQREGYRFAGWMITNMDTNTTHYYYNSSIGIIYETTKSSLEWTYCNVFENLTSISGSTVIFTAIWYDEDESYEIEYTLDGGTTDVEYKTVVKIGEEITVDAPTREGYVFTGWTISVSSSDGESFGSTLYESTTDTVFSNLSSSSGKVTFYANWEPA